MGFSPSQLAGHLSNIWTIVFFSEMQSNFDDLSYTLVQCVRFVIRL